MKKRVLAIILFIAVIISSLSGCKDNNGRYDDGQQQVEHLQGMEALECLPPKLCHCLIAIP